MNMMKELDHNFTDNKQNELAVRFRCSQEEDVELEVGDVTDLLFQNRMPGVGGVCHCQYDGCLKQPWV